MASTKHIEGDVPYTQLGPLQDCQDYFHTWTLFNPLDCDTLRILNVRRQMTQPWSGYFDGRGASAKEMEAFFLTPQFRDSSKAGCFRLPLRPRYQGQGLERPWWAESDTYPYVHYETPSSTPIIMWTSAAWRF